MAVSRVSPVLVGRRVESARLRRLLSAVREGSVATVIVTGEAGAGKSRIVDALVREVTDEVSVLFGTCVELGTGSLPFGPFIAALRRVDVDEVRAMLPSGAADALVPLLPGVASVVPSASDEARARMFEFLLDLLVRLSARRPCLLVIEDAHWADPSSRDLLEFLVRSQSAAPGLMIVVTHRSAELAHGHPLRRQVAELTRLDWVHRVDLSPLKRHDVVEQARAILGHEPDPEYIASIHQRSGGNPLYVEALLDSDVDNADEGVPPALTDVLLDRVRTLPEPAVRVVRVASVAGARVGHRLLEDVLHRINPGSDMDVGLRAAIDGGVLTVESDGYAFRHALIHEVTYADLLPGERTRLHAHYADALSHDEDLATRGRPAAEVGHHLFCAGEIDRALGAAWRASREAHQSLAYAEELELLERILRHWSSLPEPAGLIGASRIDVLTRAVEAAIRAGAHVRGVELATDALAALDPDTERVPTALMLERRAAMQATVSGAVNDLREALRVVPDEHPARGVLLNALAIRLSELPRPGEAAHVAEEALRLSHAMGDPATEASATVTLAVLQARTGDLDAQLPRFAHARAVAESIGATGIALRAWHSESHLLEAFGQLHDAIWAARQGMAAAQRAGLARARAAEHVADLVTALIAAGQWDEAVETVEYGLSLAPPPDDQAQLLCHKGYVALHRGELAVTE